ncbi:MAG: S-methyl-5-thioribose-1-phosphate isomerase [Nitrospiraceae bacterium]|nr:S-methyl-5-thioribose-1-phosphate isomerase [Nitrospiraceae bacterium]
MVKAIEWRDGKVILLDQSRLPIEVKFIECNNYQLIVEAIKKLWIRGAPAIGIAAAMGIALGAQDLTAKKFKEFFEGINKICDFLLLTRPTAVNIKWAIERIKKMLRENKHESVNRLKELLISEALKIHEEDIEVNKAIGRYGAKFIKDGDTILTHCNAGCLATGGYGTATSAIYTAIEQGKKIQVIADETRPVLQGARLTAWEFMQAGVPVTLITDNTAGALIKKGEINLAIVGTDRTVRNGDVANKIGTYTVAVLCKENKIPFYVAAPLSSIDFKMPNGSMIPIEERDTEEVTHIFGKCQIAPDNIMVRNLAFDVTPAKYITAIVTEKGAFRPKDLRKIAKKNANLEEIRI